MGSKASTRHECIKCAETSSPRFRTGPDGSKSLCNRCYYRYRNRRMVVYQDKRGRLSVLQKRGSRPMRVTGFTRKEKGGSSVTNFFQPLIEPFNSRQTAKASQNNEAHENDHHDQIRHRLHVNTCLHCKKQDSSELQLGPDGPTTLCLLCHTSYSCRELPLYEDLNGVITVCRSPQSQRVDHVGFHLQGMQRDLTRPIIKPWLGKARQKATVLTARTYERQLHQRTARPNVSKAYLRTHGISPHPSSVAAANAHMQRRHHRTAVQNVALEKGSSSKTENAVGIPFPMQGTSKTTAQVTGVASDLAHQQHFSGTGGIGMRKSAIPPKDHDKPTTEEGKPRRLLEISGQRCGVRSGIAVKATCLVRGGTETRRFAFNLNHTAESFIEFLQDIFELEDFYIRYKDPANDEITVSTGAEIRELFAVFLECDMSPICIDVIPLCMEARGRILSRGLIEVVEQHREYRKTIF